MGANHSLQVGFCHPRPAAAAVLAVGLVAALSASATAVPVFHGREATVYATVTNPAEIEFAPDGSLFAAHNSPSNSAERIYRIPPGGGAASLWGTQSPKDPDGLDVFGDDVYCVGEYNVWQADRATGTMAKWTNWTTNRNMTTIAVDELGDYGAAGDVVVGSARYTYDIEFVSAATRSSTVQVASTNLYIPRGLLFAAGTLYCVESSAIKGVWAISAAGALTRVDDQQFAWGAPSAMVYDPADDVFYVGDSTRDEIICLPRTGGAPEVVGTGFTAVDGLAFGPDGKLYVADSPGNVVWQAVPEPGTLLLLFAAAALPLSRRRRSSQASSHPLR